MGFQFEAFLSFGASFPLRFVETVVVIKASELQHVLKIWFRWLSNGLFCVKYFCS